MAYELKVDVDEVYSWSHLKFNNWVQYLHRRNDQVQRNQIKRKQSPAAPIRSKPSADLSNNKTAETLVNSPFFAKLPMSTQTA